MPGCRPWPARHIAKYSEVICQDGPYHNFAGPTQTFLASLVTIQGLIKWLVATMRP